MTLSKNGAPGAVCNNGSESSGQNGSAKAAEKAHAKNGGQEIDLRETEQFLCDLSKTKANTRLRFISPKDTPEECKKPAIPIGLDCELARELQQEGYGVYIVVGDGGDDDASITGIPAFFADDDSGRTLEEFKADIANAGLPPASFINFSGKRGHHAYWRLEEPITDMERFRRDQKGIIAAVETDPVIYNPSRVMRLPGFRHVTYEGGLGEMVRRVDEHRVNGELVRYRIEEIESKLPSLEEAERHERAKAADKRHQAEKKKPSYVPQPEEEIKEALKFYPPRVPDSGTYPEDRNMGWGLVAVLMEARGCSREEAIEVAIVWLKVHSPKWKNVEQVIRSGNGSIGAGSFWMYAEHHGYKRKPTHRKREPIPLKIVSFTDAAETKPPAKLILLGLCWLFRGGWVAIIGPTGQGKTSITAQMGALWALALAAFGIKPNGALRIMLVQVENGDDDIHEMCSGILDEIGGAQWQRDLLRENFKWITPEKPSPELFAEDGEITKEIEAFRPDILILDSLYKWTPKGNAADSEGLHHTIDQTLIPLAKRLNFGLFCSHHMSRTEVLRLDKNEDTALSDLYAGAGGMFVAASVSKGDDWFSGALCLYENAK